MEIKYGVRITFSVMALPSSISLKIVLRGTSVPVMHCTVQEAEDQMALHFKASVLDCFLRFV